MQNRKIFILVILLVINSGCGLYKKNDFEQQYSQQEKTEFDSAQIKFSNRKYEEAQKLYMNFINRFPDSVLVPEAYLKTALITEPDNSEKALEIYLQIIRDYPDSDAFFEASIHAANILAGISRPQEAISICDKALSKTDSENMRIRILYAKANALFNLQKYYDAVDVYNEIFMKDPGQYPQIRPFIAKTASQMDKESLLKSFDLFLNNDASALFKKYFALALLKENNQSDAKKILQEILDKYPATETYFEAKDELQLIEKKGKISIGVILPLSGQFAPYGEMALKAIQFAVSDFTYQNPGINIKLLIEDNRSLDTGSEEAAKKLIENKVSAIVGPFHTAEKACEYAEKNLIPIIPMTHKPSITKNKKFVFRHFITPSMQAEALVTFAREKLSLDTFAILYPDESYGETFMDAFFDSAIKNGCKIMGVEKYSTDSADFSDSIKKLTGLYYKDLREIKPESDKIDTEDEELKPVIDFKAVFIPDGPLKAASIAPQLAYFDVYDAVFLGPNLWNDERLVKSSEGYIKKAYFTSLFFEQSEDEKIKTFSDSFESLFGQKPGFIEAISYDSAMILFNSVKKAGSASPELIRDAIISTSVFDSITGPTFFEINGECVKELIILQSDNKGIKAAFF
ncbi:MAG: penicillin-binding protein activator [Desulfobacteraceae bacterium]|nr:penicillin-binding protein activator [Desulfobacteraceae bacterium]